MSATLTTEKRERLGSRCLDLGFGHREVRIFTREFGSVFTGSLSEDDEIGERVASESVGSVEARGTLTGRKKAGDIGHLCVGVDRDATHGVVRRGTDLHRFLGDVHAGQRIELVVHARQLALDMRLGIRHLLANPRDVEEDTAVRTPPAFTHFAHDAPGHVVSREELRWPTRIAIADHVALTLFGCVRSLVSIQLRDIVEHESTTFRVPENAAFAAHAFCDENAAW